MNITESDFQSLCDSFQAELDITSDEEFLVDSETVLTLGNTTWQVHIFPTQNLDAPREPLIQLFSSRRDLVRAIVYSQGMRGYLKSAYALAEWLEERGFGVGLEAQSPWAKAKLFVFNKFVDVFHFFKPH